VRLWRVADGTVVRTLEGHTYDVSGVAFAADGQTLASGALDGTLRLWRVRDGTLLRTVQAQTSEVLSVAFAPDGQTLASGSGYPDYTGQLWRAADGALLHTLTGNDYAFSSVAFAPDGQTVASGGMDRVVRLWRVADGTLLRTLQGHTADIHALAFAPDGQTLASGAGARSGSQTTSCCCGAWPTGNGCACSIRTPLRSRAWRSRRTDRPWLRGRTRDCAALAGGGWDAAAYAEGAHG